MNYFELYPGDYLRDTTRLSMLEHGAYLRMMIAYYGEEQPLPADNEELFNVCGAKTQSDSEAVLKVANRFFPISDTDGLRHNGRADEEIEKARRRILIAQQNGSKGGRKAKPKENPVGNPVGFIQVIPDETQRAAQSGEALHTPHATSTNTTEASVEASRGKHPSARTSGTPAGDVCKALVSIGIAHVNPSHPSLRELLDAGVTPEQFADTGRELTERIGIAPKFGYVLSTIRGRLADAARRPPIPAGTALVASGNHAPSKTRGAIEDLERLKNGHGLAPSGDRDGFPEIAVLEQGSDPGA